MFVVNQPLSFAQKLDTISDFTQSFRQEERVAMHVLLGWSGISAAYGGYLLSKGKQDAGSMHVSWAAINAGIAGLALWSKKPEYSSLSEYLTAEKSFNQILAINSGLDVAYVSTGILMNTMGKSNRVRDFGSAIIIQGGFLLVFDAVLFWRSNSRLNRGIELISRVEPITTQLISESVFVSGLRFRF